MKGPGYVTQSVQLPNNLLRSIGCNWTCCVWDAKPDAAYMDAVLKTYENAFGPGLLVCGSIVKVREAWKRWKNWVILPYNEPSQWMQDAPMFPPEELAIIYKQLAREKIKAGGPNLGIVPADADYIKRFKAEGGVASPWVNHSYGRTLAQIPSTEIISEHGMDPVLPPSKKLAWALEAIRSGKTLAIYQAVDTVGEGWMVNANYTKPWELTADGVALRDALAPSPVSADATGGVV